VIGGVVEKDLKLVYEALERRFDGRQLLRPDDLSIVLGRKLGTIYNQISGGKFPIPVLKKGGHPRCRLIDVAKFLSNGF
jgi:hypothetical protein